MRTIPTTPHLERAEFGDFDAFRDHLRGWDCRPIQLGPGWLRISWIEVRLGQFGLAALSVNRRIADASALEPGEAGFAVTLRRHTWCGLDVPRGSLLVLGPECARGSVLLEALVHSGSGSGSGPALEVPDFRQTHSGCAPLAAR